MIGPIGLVKTMCFYLTINKNYKKACKIEDQAKRKLDTTSRCINNVGYILTKGEHSQILNLTIEIVKLEKSINDLFYFAYDLPLSGYRNVSYDKILKDNKHLRYANPFDMIKLLKGQIDSAKVYVKELKDLTSVYVFKNEEIKEVSTNA